MTNKTKMALAAALVAALVTPAVAQAQDYGYRVKHERLIEGRNSAFSGDDGSLTGSYSGREALIHAN
jgi:hypothetical protein